MRGLRVPLLACPAVPAGRVLKRQGTHGKPGTDLERGCVQRLSILVKYGSPKRPGHQVTSPQRIALLDKPAVAHIERLGWHALKASRKGVASVRTCRVSRFNGCHALPVGQGVPHWMMVVLVVAGVAS